MMKTLKTAGLAAALLAGSMAAANEAEARDRYRDGGETAAIAIGAGILGLAIGAALADRDDRNYYDRDYYRHRRYVSVRGRPGHYYYYDNAPRRYYRDRYYDRYYGRYYNQRYRNRWDRGYDKINRWYGRSDRRYDRRDYRRDRRDYRRYDRRDYRRDRRDYRGDRRDYRHSRRYRD